MPTTFNSALHIEPFLPSDLVGAAGLLADRQRRHRLAEPLLDPRFEAVDGARAAIEEALSGDLASGVSARRGDEVVGYLIGQQKDTSVWGPNVWIEAAGHAALEPAIVRSMYAALSADWVADGRTNHHVLVPASDEALVDAWFSLDFGQQHVHAIREVPDATFSVVPPSEIIVRAPTAGDIDALTELELVLPRHLRGAPVFSTLQIEPTDAVRAEVAADLDDPTYTWFVADHQGAVVGVGIGCALSVSGGHHGPNAAHGAALLAYAAVLPEVRGMGAGRVIGESILAWARDAGYPSIATDWRSANIEADRAWRALGFRPTFRRMHRLIG